MAQPLPPRMTLAEYLAFERASDEKHEFVDGHLIPLHHDSVTGMAGGSPLWLGPQAGIAQVTSSSGIGRCVDPPGGFG